MTVESAHNGHFIKVHNQGGEKHGVDKQWVEKTTLNPKIHQAVLMLMLILYYVQHAVIAMILYKTEINMLMSYRQIG